MTRGRGSSEEKPSTAEAVRIVISENLPYFECLADEVVNYTWLAEKIADDVKKITGKSKVNIDAVKAALIRFQQELKKEKRELYNKVYTIIAKSTLELQNDITIITVRKEAIEKALSKILTTASEARFFNLTQGKKIFNILISSEDEEKITSVLDSSDLVDRVDGQSAILIISPYEIMNTPGVIEYITRLMYVNGINITQIISCYTDTLLIISSKQVVKAFEVLQKSITDSRKLLEEKKTSV